jgi:hypothetical protein
MIANVPAARNATDCSVFRCLLCVMGCPLAKVPEILSDADRMDESSFVVDANGKIIGWKPNTTGICPMQTLRVVSPLCAKLCVTTGVAEEPFVSNDDLHSANHKAPCPSHHNPKLIPREYPLSRPEVQHAKKTKYQQSRYISDYLLIVRVIVYLRSFRANRV